MRAAPGCFAFYDSPPGGGDAARIGELLEGSFAENERQRILALDRIELGR